MLFYNFSLSTILKLSAMDMPKIFGRHEYIKLDIKANENFNNKNFDIRFSNQNRNLHIRKYA